MRVAAFLLWILAPAWVVSACVAPESEAPPPVTRVTRAYGEPESGFPTWYERMIHVLVNRARADPPAALAPCAPCGAAGCCADHVCFTTPRPPLWWRADLARSSRFHAQNLTATGCGMSHDSPCTLVSNIDALYPGSCDGAAACACADALSCGAGDDFATRLSRFGVSNWVAENIAGYGDPVAIFDAWLLENASDATCQWSSANGHRWNILGDYTHLGVGGYGSFTVQDFHRTTAESHRIPAGAHYPETGAVDIAFRANWYDTQGPRAARVNLGGTCYSMMRERGQPANSTWLRVLDPGAGCQRYYFLFSDSLQQPVTYPDSGSFGLNCPDDWSIDRPAVGTNCDCLPACSGRDCGDDGCGGVCGECAATETCVNHLCTGGPDAGVDAGAAMDGGAGADAASGVDAAPGVDGGGGGGGAGGGCSCRSGATRSTTPLWWLLVLLALGVRRRRSRCPG